MQRAKETIRGDQLGVIPFENLHASDRILIRTQNNNYRFLVIDPVKRRGMLTGGLLGDVPREAVLVGTLGEGRNDLKVDATGLKVEAQALFYIRAKIGVSRMVTSEISDLAHVRGGNAKQFAA
jgi:hypothetical protein